MRPRPLRPWLLTSAPPLLPVWSAGVEMASTPAVLWAGIDLNVPANRGKHIGIATVRHDASSTVQYGLTSSVFSTVVSAYPVDSGVATATDELIMLGEVSIPAVPMPEGDFTAKTPVTVTCAEADKYAVFLALVRIPADIGAVIASGAFPAGTGWKYHADEQTVYPFNGSYVNGVQMNPYRTGKLSAPPGRNVLVVASDGGDVTVSGTMTPLSLSRG